MIQRDLCTDVGTIVNPCMERSIDGGWIDDIDARYVQIDRTMEKAQPIMLDTAIIIGRPDYRIVMLVSWMDL